MHIEQLKSVFGVWEAGKRAVAKMIWYKPWAAEPGRGGGGQWGQLPSQNIKCGGIVPMIVHSHDGDMASPFY